MIGEFSSNIIVDVSSYNASSVEEFIAVCSSGDAGQTRYSQTLVFTTDISGGGSYTSPSLSLNNGFLTVTVGTIQGYLFSSGSQVNDRQTTNLKTKVYYIGKISE